MLQSQLIDEVKKRRWMFDKKLKEYANRKDWFKMVAELLNMELAPYQVQCSVSELMAMWDEMYNNFKKIHQSVSNATSGSSAAILKIVNDPLYQALLFVEDTIKPRPPLSSLENVGETSDKGQGQSLQGPHSFSNMVQSNFNMRQVKSGKKKRVAQKNTLERGKFKKQTCVNDELLEAKKVLGTVKKLIEKTADDVNKAQEQSNMPVDENKQSVQNMLTKKFLQLTPENIELAFKEIRSGILTLFGESSDGTV